MTWALMHAAAEFPVRKLEAELSGYRGDRACQSGVRRLTNTHNLLLALLASWSDRRSGRHCYYSVPQLAQLAGVNERWARRALRDLEACGLVETKLGGGRLGRDPKTGRMLGRASTYRVAINGGLYAPLKERTNGGRPAPLESQLTGAGRPPQTGRSPDARRAHASARDGMRFASSADSAQENLLEAPRGPSRQPADAGAPLRSAPSGDGSPHVAAPLGEIFARAKIVQPPPGEAPAAVVTISCPSCGALMQRAEYSEHHCGVGRPRPRRAEQPPEPPPAMSAAQLLAEHEWRIAQERARKEASDV